MKLLFLIFSLFDFCFGTLAQSNTTQELIIGNSEYKIEVIKIVEKYSMLLDSVRNIRFSKKLYDSLDADSNVPMNYPGYDGGYEAYLMYQEVEKIMSI